MGSKPKLIVFDLDYTLWAFFVDCHPQKPFKKDCHGQVYDKVGQKLTYYKDVPDILKKLHSEGYLLGIASRTSDPDGAQQLINLFGWNKYFTFKQMYPGSKVTHFRRIEQESGVSPSEMIFFDDEPRNIFDIRRLGATCVLVEDGVNFQYLEQAFQTFNRLN